MSVIYHLIMRDQGSFLSNPTLHDTAWKWSQSMAKKKKAGNATGGMGFYLGWPWTQGVRVKAGDVEKSRNQEWHGYNRAGTDNGQLWVVGNRRWGGSVPKWPCGFVLYTVTGKNTYTPRHGAE